MHQKNTPMHACAHRHPLIPKESLNVSWPMSKSEPAAGGREAYSGPAIRKVKLVTGQQNKRGARV
jgi:hypothetical protein